MDTSNSRLVEIILPQSRQIKHYVNKQRIEDFAERIFIFISYGRRYMLLKAKP